MKTKKTIMTALSATFLAVAGLVAFNGASSAGDSAAACSPATIKGAYGVKLNGVVQVPGLPERKLNAVALMTFDGAGKFNASLVGRINGDSLTPSTITAGAYSVNGDCTGRLELTQIFRGFSNVQAAFVIVERGRELDLVVDAAPPPANPAIIQIGGEAERVGGDRSDR